MNCNFSVEEKIEEEKERKTEIKFLNLSSTFFKKTQNFLSVLCTPTKMFSI